MYTRAITQGDIVDLMYYGPRPLTEACLVAREPEKYTLGENHDNH